MIDLPLHLFVGVLALFATLAVRAVSANRFIVRRVRMSVLLLVAFIGINLLLVHPSGRALHDRMESIESLVLALALINLVVVLTFNPFREDRVSERFPSVVQDAITIAVFVVVSTVFMREKFLTTSAVSAVVIGFALQDTFGNMFAGLAIQVEKPFKVGDWVAISHYEGKINEITWRATKLRTKAGNFVVIPNNLIAKEAVTNYSEPIQAVRLVVNVGAGYDVPPNRVKETIEEALRREPAVLDVPAPEAFAYDFAASSITYRVEFWISDFANETRSLDRARTAIYYAFHRESIEIPYPILDYRRIDRTTTGAEGRQRELQKLIDEVDLFAPLFEEQRRQLLTASRERLFGHGERIVAQGDAGRSLFLVTEGAVRVLIEPGDHEVAELKTGEYFGEMSLLTGEPRSATVRAAHGDCQVLEITADTFKHLVGGSPQLLEQISAVVANRRVELEQHRTAATAPVPVADVQRSLFARIQQFFRL